MDNKKYYISIDVGGTNVRIGLFEVGKKIKLLDKKNLPVSQNYTDGVSSIVSIIKMFQKEYNICGIGASFPGRVDEENPKNNAYEHLPDWNEKPIAQDISTMCDVKVKLINDAAGAALGEAVFGAGKNEGHFNFMIWGSGFGGAHIKKVAGKHLILGFEPGHHSLDLNGDKCPCGQQGCIELHLGGISLKKQYGDLNKIKDNDPLWLKVIEVATLSILNTLVFYPTSKFIFGGGLIQKRSFLLEEIEKELKVHSTVFAPPKLVLTHFGDDTALYGGVALFESDYIL